MQHPFELIPANEYAKVFLPSLVLTLIIWLCLLAIDPSNFLKEIFTQTNNFKHNIVNFALAGDDTTISEILRDWEHEGQIRAALSLGLDFLFIPLYTVTISLACVWVARHLVWISWLGLSLAWLQCVAGILDVVEDIALIRILLSDQNSFLPWLAKSCAIPKCWLIGLGISYGLVGWLVIGILGKTT